MKLVAVSVVKNEADVIEAFVRHTGAWVDEHLIFDHDSTDGTRQILFQLVTEGLPLRLFAGSAMANLQQARSNHLATLAFSEFEADWVLPLDADEFIVAPDRAALELALSDGPADSAVSIPLRNYSPTTSDDLSEANPALRLRHRLPGQGTTFKVFIPRGLGTRPNVTAGKGNHALYEGGQPLSARPLVDVALAHLALRSPYQQVLRVVTAELQKLSRGQAHEGLDIHYRLGFQLLAEDADLFFSTVLQPAERLRLDPVNYRGAALRYLPMISEFARSARALVPFLERMARSHGQLIDRRETATEDTHEIIGPLHATDDAPLTTGTAQFTGFTALSGWQQEEGPYPEAFLPRFHWATAPETVLAVDADFPRMARLEARLLTYAPNQRMTVLLNGSESATLDFARVNQMETLVVPLSLQAGSNEVVLRYRTWIESTADPRKLAVIFLGLRILALNALGQSANGQKPARCGSKPNPCITQGTSGLALGLSLCRTTSCRCAFNPEDYIMLKWAIISAVIAVIAGALGFGVIAGAAAGIAKILFFIFLVVFVVLLVSAIFVGKKVKSAFSNKSDDIVRR